MTMITAVDTVNVQANCVGDNGILPVESAKRKLTYAEIVNASSAVERQNKIVAAEKLSTAATT